MAHPAPDGRRAPRPTASRPRRRVRLALAGAALAAAAAAAGGSIAFIRGDNVWIAAPDGSGARQVTADGTADDPYSGVAAAKRVPVLAYRQKGDVGLIGADGSNRREIAPGALPAFPNPINPTLDVSADGSRVAYMAQTTLFSNGILLSYLDAFRVNADGTAPAEFSRNSTTSLDVAFADPAGETAAVSRDGLGGTAPGCDDDLLKIGIDAGAPVPASGDPTYATLICRGDRNLSDPAPTPDGATVVAISSPAAATDSFGSLVAIPRGNPSSETALAPGAQAMAPDVSPDGTAIVFEGPGRTLWTVPAGGGQPTRILEDAGSPAWSPFAVSPPTGGGPPQAGPNPPAAPNPATPTTRRGVTRRGTVRAGLLRGSARADRLTGLAGRDRLFGLGGADTLLAGPGDDTVNGGPGRGVLDAGPGRDVVLARDGARGADPGDRGAARGGGQTAVPASSSSPRQVSRSQSGLPPKTLASQIPTQ